MSDLADAIWRDLDGALALVDRHEVDLVTRWRSDPMSEAFLRGADQGIEMACAQGLPVPPALLVHRAFWRWQTTENLELQRECLVELAAQALAYADALGEHLADQVPKPSRPGGRGGRRYPGGGKLPHDGGTE